MYFIHTFLTNTFRPLFAAIFRVMLLLQEYKRTNVVSCVAVTPKQLKIIIISVKII